jgi:AraC family transcriptional regulator
MEKAVRQAVGRVIESMRVNLGEPITIDDMARTAMFSKFHFTRVFQRATGVSPGRFLSAMRLQEAKQLLVSTSLTVTEISHRVGYTSLGTFSSRFTASVGISPSTYRQLGGFAHRISVDSQRNVAEARSGVVWGEILPSRPDLLSPVFIGLFPGPIPEGKPVRCAVLGRPGRYRLELVPRGTWHLLAQSAVSENEPPGIFDQEMDNTSVGSSGPITIGPDTVARCADVVLRPMSELDPPVLLALLDARSAALGV